MDRIFRDFLDVQLESVMDLAGSTDLMTVQPLDRNPTRRYVIEFRCRGLELVGDQVVERDRWLVHISLHDDYLRRIRPERIASLVTPAWHPNSRGPFLCLGRIRPGTELVDLCYQIYGILSYQEVTPREDDALNSRACRWVRANMDRLPTDVRPLVWRASVPDATTGAAP